MKYLIAIFLLGSGWALYGKYQVYDVMSEVSSDYTVTYRATSSGPESKDVYVFTDYNQSCISTALGGGLGKG